MGSGASKSRLASTAKVENTTHGQDDPKLQGKEPTKDSLQTDAHTEPTRDAHGAVKTEAPKQKCVSIASPNRNSDDDGNKSPSSIASEAIRLGQEQLFMKRMHETGAAGLLKEKHVESAMQTIAAAVVYNQITAEDAYEAFDMDEDGMLSLADLQTAIQTLNLGIDQESTMALFDALDTARQGYIDINLWVDAVSASDVLEVLKSRGISLISEQDKPPNQYLKTQQTVQPSSLQTAGSTTNSQALGGTIDIQDNAGINDDVPPMNWQQFHVDEEEEAAAAAEAQKREEEAAAAAAAKKREEEEAMAAAEAQNREEQAAAAAEAKKREEEEAAAAAETKKLEEEAAAAAAAQNIDEEAAVAVEEKKREEEEAVAAAAAAEVKKREEEEAAAAAEAPKSEEDAGIQIEAAADTSALDGVENTSSNDIVLGSEVPVETAHGKLLELASAQELALRENLKDLEAAKEPELRNQIVDEEQARVLAETDELQKQIKQIQAKEQERQQEYEFYKKQQEKHMEEMQHQIEKHYKDAYHQNMVELQKQYDETLNKIRENLAQQNRSLVTEKAALEAQLEELRREAEIRAAQGKLATKATRQELPTSIEEEKLRKAQRHERETLAAEQKRVEEEKLGAKRRIQEEDLRRLEEDRRLQFAELEREKHACQPTELQRSLTVSSGDRATAQLSTAAGRPQSADGLEPMNWQAYNQAQPDHVKYMELQGLTDVPERLGMHALVPESSQVQSEDFRQSRETYTAFLDDKENETSQLQGRALLRSGVSHVIDPQNTEKVEKDQGLSVETLTVNLPSDQVQPMDLVSGGVEPEGFDVELAKEQIEKDSEKDASGDPEVRTNIDSFLCAAEVGEETRKEEGIEQAPGVEDGAMPTAECEVSVTTAEGNVDLNSEANDQDVRDQVHMVHIDQDLGMLQAVPLNKASESDRIPEEEQEIRSNMDTFVYDGDLRQIIDQAPGVEDVSSPCEEEWRFLNETIVGAKETIARLELESHCNLNRSMKVIQSESCRAEGVFACAMEGSVTESELHLLNSFSRVAGIVVKLALDFSAAGCVGSAVRRKFEGDLCQDLANASGIFEPINFQIKDIACGSIVAYVQIRSSQEGPDPQDAAAELEEQATDPNSPLRAGCITRFTESITQIPVPIESRVEETLGMITPETFSVSEVIFEEDTEQIDASELTSAEDAHHIQEVNDPVAKRTEELHKNVDMGRDSASLETKLAVGMGGEATALAGKPDASEAFAEASSTAAARALTSPTDIPSSVNTMKEETNHGLASAPPDLQYGKPADECGTSETIAEGSLDLNLRSIGEDELAKEQIEKDSEKDASGDPEVRTNIDSFLCAAEVGEETRKEEGIEQAPGVEDGAMPTAECEVSVTTAEGNVDLNSEANDQDVRDQVKIENSKALQEERIQGQRSASEWAGNVREGSGLIDMMPTACAGLEHDALPKEGTSVVIDVPTRKILKTLRPLPASLRSKKQGTQSIRETSIDTEMSPHANNGTSSVNPSSKNELLLLRESHSQLLERVHMLEDALQAFPISSESDTNRSQRANAQENLSCTTRDLRFQAQTTISKTEMPLLSEEYHFRLRASGKNEESIAKSNETCTKWEMQSRSKPKDESFRSKPDILRLDHLEASLETRAETPDLWSSTSTANLKSTNSFNSLASQAVVNIPTQLKDHTTSSVCTGGIGRAKIDRDQSAQLMSQVSSTVDHDTRLSLRTERYQSASPLRKYATVQSRAGSKSIPSKSNDDPAWWEVNQTAQLELDGQESVGSNAHVAERGRRLLPWERERDALRRRDDQVSEDAFVHNKVTVCGTKSQPSFHTGQQSQLFLKKNADRVSPSPQVHHRQQELHHRKELNPPKEANVQAKNAQETSLEAEKIEPNRRKTRARILDTSERKANVEAQLVADLMEKGGVCAGSMGKEEKWLVHLKTAISACGSDYEDKTCSSKAMLELEAVYGCVGASGKGLCHLTSSGEVVFPASSTCVLISSDGQQQRLFRQHDQEVSSLCLHPNGRLVASGSRAKSCADQVQIILWDSNTLKKVSVLYPGHTSGIGLLSFSKDQSSIAAPGDPNSSGIHALSHGGRYLVSVGTDTFHSLILWDIKSFSKVVSVFGSSDVINAVSFGSHNESIVTCGSRNVKFWTISSSGKPEVGSTPLSQLKGHASGRSVAAVSSGETVLVGWKGTLPLSRKQEQRGMSLSSASEVVMTSMVLSPSGLVTGSQEGIVYLWDEDRRETVKTESCKAHDGPVLQLSLWGAHGMVSGGQDGGVVLWSCGERTNLPSYGHITQLKKVYVKGLDGKIQISSTYLSPTSENNDDAVDQVITGVHSLSCVGDQILVGTRCSKMLLLDFSDMRSVQSEPVHKNRAEQKEAPKLSWSEQLRAAQRARETKNKRTSSGGNELLAGSKLENLEVPGHSNDVSLGSTKAETGYEDLSGLRARLLSDGFSGPAWPGCVSTHFSGWGCEVFCKVLSISDSGCVTLRKGVRGQSFCLLPGLKASSVAILPSPVEDGDESTQLLGQGTSDTVLEDARKLLEAGGFAGSPTAKNRSSPSKMKKDRERELLRRRQVIAAQGGEFGIFAIGLDNGVIILLRECAAAEDGPTIQKTSSVTLTTALAGYEVICQLNLQELASAQLQACAASNFGTSEGWKPLPSASGLSNAAHGNQRGLLSQQPIMIGSVTAMVFEARAWDERQGTCRLAVGTELGIVLVCQVLKEGSGARLSTASKWSVTVLPPPPGAHDGPVCTIDWSRCGRYLRACGDVLKVGVGGASVHRDRVKQGRPTGGYTTIGRKGSDSWMRVWSVGAGGQAEWDRSGMLAMAESGGTNIFLHPLHLDPIRLVEWCSGYCLHHDSLFDSLLSASSCGGSIGDGVGVDGGKRSVGHGDVVGSNNASTADASPFSCYCTCVSRDTAGSTIVIGSSDGSLSVLQKQADGGGHAAMRRFDAHSVAVGGVQVISPDYFVSWGNRQQFLFLWKVRRDNE